MTHCASCRRTYDALAWSKLRRVRTLTDHDVNAYVLVWPRDAVVEVRACSACGRDLARLVTAA